MNTPLGVVSWAKIKSMVGRTLRNANRGLILVGEPISLVEPDDRHWSGGRS
jgi:hypothetical protein